MAMAPYGGITNDLQQKYADIVEITEQTHIHPSNNKPLYKPCTVVPKFINMYVLYLIL